MIRVTIRPLTVADRDAALNVINTAARWYRDFLPPDELHDPEMTAAQWDEEARRLAWYGGFLDSALLAVMGLERSRDAALLRHAHILPEHQHHGIGLRLVEHLELVARREGAGVRRIVVGPTRGTTRPGARWRRQAIASRRTPRRSCARTTPSRKTGSAPRSPTISPSCDRGGNMPTTPRAQILKIADLVEYQDGSVVSRIVVKAETGSVTLFAFDEGQDLSEHMVPFDGLVHVLEGEVEIKISGKLFHLRIGDAIVMPANEPHAVKAVKRFKMLLTMIRA